MNLRKAAGIKILAPVFVLVLIAVLSGTAFALQDVDFTQCANDTDDSGLFETCKWISGALQQNNSRYAESDGVPQRLIFKHTSAVANETHTVTFRYDFTKGNVYGYDFLVDPDHTVPTTLLNFCGCQRDHQRARGRARGTTKCRRRQQPRRHQPGARTSARYD